MKTFKQYLLTEGWGQVKKNFVNPGKISMDDLKAMKTFFSELGDKTGKMGEWFAKYWVDNNKR